MPKSCLAVLWPTRAEVLVESMIVGFLCAPSGAGCVGVVAGCIACGVGDRYFWRAWARAGFVVSGAVSGGSGFWRWEMGKIRQKKV